MAVARVLGAQPAVLHADMVTVEADLSRGLHSFTIVGLPGKAVEEARDRVSSAIKNSGFTSPKSKNHKVVISLAPADLKKEGPLFDLPIALSYLIAAREMSGNIDHILFLGELALDGALRPVKGVLPVVQKARAAGVTEVIVPKENAEEAALVSDIVVFGADSLSDVIRHIDAKHEAHQKLKEQQPTDIAYEWQPSTVHLEDIKGQEHAKRGLLIAAAGRHNVIMVGPPGTGKTMLARAFQNILPPLSKEEALEVTAIHSISGALNEPVIVHPPFRSPHHTASHTSLVGGGTNPRPGEVTLAHRGVLFLDEFPEFERRSIDALRQPLEDRVVSITRVQGSALFPANFILLAAMNPYRDRSESEGSEVMLEQYKKKISGPIMDRIDLWLDVSHIDYDTLEVRTELGEETKRIRKDIQNARVAQSRRFNEHDTKTNGEMSARAIEELMVLTDEARSVLKQSAEKLKLSPRSYHRVIKISRTIADLEEAPLIEAEHILEALQYRPKI